MNRQNVKEEKELPTEHEYGNPGHGDGKDFAERHARAAGFKAAGKESENVERGEAEYRAPKQIVEREAPAGRELEGKKHG